MTKLVIFDLDGTLIDTLSDLAKSCNHALGACGYPLRTLEEYRTFVGNGVDKLLERSLPLEEQTEANVARMRALFKPHYNEHGTEMTAPYEGIVAMLQELTEQGIQVAVASNKYQLATEALVHHFFGAIPFASILGQREGVNPKPDPIIVFDILKETGVELADALYVGDSEVDMQTAQRAGVHSLGVTWGFRPASLLREHGAGALVDHASEVITHCHK